MDRVSSLPRQEARAGPFFGAAWTAITLPSERSGVEVAPPRKEAAPVTGPSACYPRVPEGGCFLALISRLLSTAALGALDLWAGIPAGLILGLSPLASGAAATCGGLAGVVLVTLGGERLQRRLYSRGWPVKRRERVERMWKRWGIYGVALQAPILTGAPLGTLIALSLGAPAGRLLLWMSASVLLWGAILTGAVALGFSVFGI